MEPRFCHHPVAFDGRVRYFEYGSGFSNAQAAEESQFHDSTQAIIEHAQLRQCVVEGQQINGLTIRERLGVLKTDPVGASASLTCTPAARVIDENFAHQTRCHRKEVHAIAECHAIEIHQPHIGFVNERRGLQRVILTFQPQSGARDSPELVIDERHEPIEGLLITALPIAQQLRDVT